MRRATWILAITLLLVSGVLGTSNGARDLARGDAQSTLQRSVVFGVALYGLLGLVGAAGLAWRRPWSVALAIAWAVVITYVASVASFAFHDPRMSQEGTLGGVIASGVATALIGAFVVWAASRAVRREASASGPD